MKKVINAIGNFFGTILGIVILFFVGVGFLIYLPFDYFKYKNSLYYKTKGKKYSLFAGLSIYFKIYNIILKNNLPIKYYNPKDETLSSGFFIYEKTLLVPELVLEYDEERQDWIVVINDDSHEPNIQSLNDFLEEEVRTVNEILGQEICEKAVVLVESDSGQIENMENAQEDSRFLIYEDLEETLKEFLNAE